MTQGWLGALTKRAAGLRGVVMKEKKNGNKQMPKLRPKREGEKSGNGARAGLRALRAREELRMVAGAVGLPIHAFAL